MRQVVTIAHNAFMELLRQPIFLLLMTASAVFAVFLASTPYFGFGEDDKLVKDSVLATMLLAGLFASIICASTSLAQEIRTGTALAVLSKPVGRIQFLLAKYLGLAAALAVLTYVNLISALIASRMAFTAYGEADKTSLFIYLGSILLAYAAGGFTNYFLRRPFVSDATFFMILFTSIAFLIIAKLARPVSMFEEHIMIDWRLVPAAILILFAFFLLAALALACSTRFDLIATLSICSGLFLLGLMSDYLFGRPAAEGTWWASMLYTIVPNWQLFWLADALENDKTIPWSYVGHAFLYVLMYLGATLALALALFEDRELS
jgi:ABC-type transport system involved in multi-copper enzyme maturation permease subunit